MGQLIQSKYRKMHCSIKEGQPPWEHPNNSTLVGSTEKGGEYQQPQTVQKELEQSTSSTKSGQHFISRFILIFPISHAIPAGLSLDELLLRYCPHGPQAVTNAAAVDMCHRLVPYSLVPIDLPSPPKRSGSEAVLERGMEGVIDLDWTDDNSEGSKQEGEGEGGELTWKKGGGVFTRGGARGSWDGEGGLGGVVDWGAASIGSDLDSDEEGDGGKKWAQGGA